MAQLIDTFNAGTLPQDPFLPQSAVQGPSFLDTEACLCALQKTPGQANSNAAWQCIGNQTQGVYEVSSGKWFDTLHGGDNVNGSIWDDSNGPDTSKPMQWQSGQARLVPADLHSLSVYDAACTGKNRSSFSTSFYRAVGELAQNQEPVDAAPCWRPGAFPMQIQNATLWADQGCNEGFLCTNNTINSSPQFCPPITTCQMARLAGMVCTLDGANIGMGPFEPVVCQQGTYCPPPGTSVVPCPAGSYCQPGCSTPTPCSFGSTCPKGSSYETYWIPLVVLILADITLIAVLIWLAIRARFRRHANAYHGQADPLKKMEKPTRIGTFKNVMSGYRQLDSGAETEMALLNATYMPGQDAWAGFQEALDMAQLQGVHVGDIEAGLSPQLRAFIESMRRATDATHLGLSFAYTDLGFQPRKSDKPILQKITGSIESGTLTAVMGGSGAGKSTFVNVLMGKTTHTRGSVMINGVPGKIKHYKKLIGYVPQDDIVLPELTVFENILHSARIRLPRSWTDDEIKSHVQSVVDCLELSHVQDSRVGSVGKPVISGGQRKRVSIGMELAAAPMAIFLDEPTSGLDATAASSIMKTLQTLSRLGISVIVIIHQPRMEIFEMLDDLILLANGELIYEGTQQETQPFFESMGFIFPPNSNFGDVVTDIITGNGGAYKKSGDISKKGLIANWENSRLNANIKSRHVSMMSQSSRDRQSARHNLHEALKMRGAPRLRQLWLCLTRSFVQQYRTKSSLLFEMGLALLAGFLLGLAENSKKGVMFIGLYKYPYEVLSLAMDTTSVPELSLLIAIAIGLISGAPGVKVFSEEQLLYRREAEAGHSRLAYFLAKIIGVLPRMILACLHFCVPLFLLAVPTISWGIAFLANVLYFWAIYGLTNIVSMVIRREDAPLISTMIALIVGILSGNAPPLSSVKSWNMEWLWRLSPGVWLSEVYFGQLVSPFSYLYQVDLAAQATGFHLDWLWRNMLILGGIGIIYRIIAFIGLLVGHRLRV